MAKIDTGDTPMMRQFREIKNQYPDAVLLFRCGDFYETYAEDAVRASKILNITLTHRSNGASKETKALEMAGFPFHALDTYLPKLVRAGLRVAICDQLEDPKLTKKLVKRGVTELVTPGVSYSETTLQQRENTWLACIQWGKQAVGVAFLDISTGEYLVAEGTADYVDKLLVNFAPKEVLFLRGKKRDFEEAFGNKYFTFELDDWMMSPTATHERLTKQYNVQNLKGFGVENLPQGVIAAGAILHYLDATQHLQTGHIQHLSRIEEDKYVWMDRFTIRNLELLNGQRENSITLYNIIDRTITPMGGRLLHRWLAFPLKEVRPIRNRQMVVEYLFRHPEHREIIRENLQHVQDMERIVSKVSTGRITPREIRQLSRALLSIAPIKEVCQQAIDTPYLHLLGEQLSLCTEIRERIQREIDEKEGLLQDIESPVDLKLVQLTHHKKRLVDVRDYCVRYNNSEKTVLNEISFAVEKGDRVVLSGKNGSGKTTLIKSILQKCNPDMISVNVTEEGICQVASGLIISYVGQETAGLKGNIENYCKEHNLDKSLFCSILRQLDFEREQFVKSIENYSEGQKKKVMLATSLLTPAHLYIWDEPLNYIDVFSRMQLEKLILQYQPTMLFVEHDIRFCEKVATKVVEL